MTEIECQNKEKFMLHREILTWKLVNEEKISPAKGDDRRAGNHGNTQNRNINRRVGLDVSETFLRGIT